MATKLTTMSDAVQDRGCLGKSQDDEPVFVLVARDRCAAAIIREWADRVGQASAQRSIVIGRPVIPDALNVKLAEARAIADAMDAWRKAHSGGKVPD